MKTNLTRSVTLFALMIATAATTQANDIVNFLNALNGNSGRRNAPVVVQPVGNHGHELGGAAFSNRGPGGRGPAAQIASSRTLRPPVNTANLRPNFNAAPQAGRSSGLQISLQFGANGTRNPGFVSPAYIPAPRPVQVLPPVPVFPAAPGHRHVAPMSFQLGQFIDCRVPLATCVHVQDECNIARNAVPVIIAVRDPNMCLHETVERLVYVQIFVPRSPLRDLHVSPCRTRIHLDYGRHEVDITSVNGVIIVDYDN